jgi:hypothetical protein
MKKEENRIKENLKSRLETMLWPLFCKHNPRSDLFVTCPKCDYTQIVNVGEDIPGVVPLIDELTEKLMPIEKWGLEEKKEKEAYKKKYEEYKFLYNLYRYRLDYSQIMDSVALDSDIIIIDMECYITPIFIFKTKFFEKEGSLARFSLKEGRLFEDEFIYFDYLHELTYTEIEKLKTGKFSYAYRSEIIDYAEKSGETSKEIIAALKLY